MEQKEIKKLILKKGLTITDVIDAAVEINSIIGVGLITLGDQLKDYCYHQPDFKIIKENDRRENRYTDPTTSKKQ